MAKLGYLFPTALLVLPSAVDNLEETLIDIVRTRGASGYTMVRAHGAGSGGEVSGELDVASSSKFPVIVPRGRMSEILAEVEALLQEGHPLTEFVSDVAVLTPEKFEKTPASQYRNMIGVN